MELEHFRCENKYFGLFKLFCTEKQEGSSITLNYFFVLCSRYVELVYEIVNGIGTFQM